MVYGGVSDGIDAAADYFENRERRDGPAQQMIELVEPLCSTNRTTWFAPRTAPGLGTKLPFCGVTIRIFRLLRLIRLKLHFVNDRYGLEDPQPEGR